MVCWQRLKLNVSPGLDGRKWGCSATPLRVQFLVVLFQGADIWEALEAAVSVAFAHLASVSWAAAWLASRSKPGKRIWWLHSRSLSCSEHCSPAFSPDGCWELPEEFGLLLLCQDLRSLPSPRLLPVCSLRWPPLPALAPGLSPRHPSLCSTAGGSGLVSAAPLNRNLPQQRKR